MNLEQLDVVTASLYRGEFLMLVTERVLSEGVEDGGSGGAAAVAAADGAAAKRKKKKAKGSAGANKDDADKDHNNDGANNYDHQHLDNNPNFF